MKEKKNNRILLTGVIITVAVTVIAVFGAFIHEPWFDEAQAYVVARDASLHDILFYLPHYEGHPPLWHLILKAALIFGLPYELTLKGVQFILFEIVIIIIEFALFEASCFCKICAKLFILVFCHKKRVYLPICHSN